jgi:hypothetical protein
MICSDGLMGCLLGMRGEEREGDQEGCLEGLVRSGTSVRLVDLAPRETRQIGNEKQ